MKSALALLPIMAFFADSTRLGENHKDERKLSEVYEDNWLFLPGRNGPNCAQFDPNGDEVLVADCSDNPAGTIWTLDADGLLNNAQGGCLKAGYGAPPQDGTRMRVRECDDTDPLFQFKFSGAAEGGNPTGTLKLKSNDELCVTIANDQPFLIMKNCEVLSEDRRTWKLSYHVIDLLFNSGFSGETGSPRGYNVQHMDIYFNLYEDFPNDFPSGPTTSWHFDDFDDTPTYNVRNGFGLCLQAGHGGPLVDGMHMRLYPCRNGNNLQVFAWNNDDGRLRLRHNQNWCVTIQNDEKYLILKPCNNEEARYRWVFA